MIRWTATLLLAACLAANSAIAAAALPNLVVILTEDQGAQAGYLGTSEVRTPHMDSLAERGVSFRNAFVYYPVCSASKAAIYTGAPNHENGLLNNTVNFHQPLATLTGEQRRQPLFRRNRVRDAYTTLPEVLHELGYYQVVTHKLHVAPNDKFPYDEFLGTTSAELATTLLERLKQQEQPWFVLWNVHHSHRPYPDSSQTAPHIDLGKVQLPPYLPDSPVVRRDWANYLAGIEEADAHTGYMIEALTKFDLWQNTIVVFLGDHGPTFQHGKMTLYDLGLRTPLVIVDPHGARDASSTVLASTIDLLPTLLDYAGQSPPPTCRGQSLRPQIVRPEAPSSRGFVFSEISDRGPLPNQGVQERCATDGRWKLIYRENTADNWRQVNADSKLPKPWGNRTYDETVRLRDEFPDAYRILTEMDPQSLDGKIPVWELYDLHDDPHEMRNRVGDPEAAEPIARLLAALRDWASATGDPAVTIPSTINSSSQVDAAAH